MAVHFLGNLGSPLDVIERPQIKPEVKRAILASWASDAFAVQSAPTLRKRPELPQPVALVDILDALKSLDRAAPGAQP